MRRGVEALLLALWVMLPGWGQDGAAAASPRTAPEPGEEKPEELLGRKREVKHSGEDLEVHVALSSGVRNYATVVSLPESSIRTVVVSWPEESVSLDHSEGKIFIKLLKRAEGHVDVLGGSGTLYRLLLRPVVSGSFDSLLEVKAAASSFEGSDGGRPPTASRKTPDALAMIRAMRLSINSQSYQIHEFPESDSGALLAKTAEFEARLAYRYESPWLVGYLVRVRNLAPRRFRVDLPRFAGAELVASGARDFVVGPGAHTYLYFVFARSR